MDPLQHLQTESIHPASLRLDELTSIEIVELMNSEDAKVAQAVATQKQTIAQAIDALAARFAQGGRLIYLGAGTSGRLGVLDASECPPTFQTPHEQIVGLIAGGPGAMFRAVEGAEDSPELGKQDLVNLQLTTQDVVCGIATSGRTPYVLGAIEYANLQGALTIGIACNPKSELEQLAQIAIVPVVGPEILSGSTRLKAGTATKLVLNMLTTGAMVRLGKTFGNLMVDLKATNSKLVARTNRIVRTILNVDAAKADDLLQACQGEVKTAIVAYFAGVDAITARQLLKNANGRIRTAIPNKALVAETTTVTLPDRLDLVLGIDGGGTNTIATLAFAQDGTILGRGAAGPSNIQSVGVELGLKALNDAIERAFAVANIPKSKVAAITLGLAGVDRQEGLEIIHGWAERQQVAQKVAVANDATLLLAAGTPDGWGLAVIAGTGSIAFVRKPTGEMGRCGGWGYTLGDEGSAYIIALTALRRAARSADRIGPKTILLERFLQRMSLQHPPDLIPAVYRGPWDRAAIAGMAPIVLDAAANDGDSIAREIIETEARELALTAYSAVKNAELPMQSAIPLALAGGVLLGSELYRQLFLSALKDYGLVADPVTLVPDPALGAVVLARRLLSQPL